jgi:RNA methyltransferase, TrmH family
MPAAYAVARVASSRRDPSLVRLEGVHALKHAVRFGAAVDAIVTPDRHEVEALLAALAPDVVLPVAPVEVDAATWRQLAGRELPSPVLAAAPRPATTARDVLAAEGVVVVLERPRHLGNLGATVRVAAAAGAGGVLVLGDVDPWHPTVVRAAAGLTYAVRVAAAASLPATDRPVVAVDPGGEPLRAGAIPADAVLVFGTERGGLRATTRERADRRVGIPMRAGVSSLNLATAVAVVLYAGS